AAPAEAGVPWLGSEETTLTSSNRALNALLVRLPRLARTGADVAIIGERGCGRTALARALAGVAGDTDPLLVRHHDELSLPSRLQLGQAADARLSARYVIAADLDLWPATKREGLARWLQEQRAAGRRIRLVATMAPAASPAWVERGLDRAGEHASAMQILRMPALRERREDLPRLARHLVVQICAQAGRPIPALTPSALQSLMLHDWPGNLYEMRQTLARALQSANMLITAEDLAPESAVGAKLPEQSLQELKAKLVVNFERSFLEQLLHASGGNLSQAARLAGKNRRSLFELIRKHQIDVTRYRAPANVSRPPTVARATLDSPG
ncbi:MAG: hypothetical protein NZL99_04815, partial [Burkholderiaceae bacterium]|nr:hypothetical protein [Burkholderiaceae bacterium]